MTPPLQDEYQMRLKLFQEHILAASRSAEMLETFRKQIIAHYPFKAEEVETLAPEIGVVVYALFKKYEQLVVLMNDNILKNVPYFEMENMAKMYRYDTIIYAEKLGIVKSAPRFVNAVALRNQLAHEYPLDPMKQAGLINNVIVESEVLIEAMSALKQFVQMRLPVWSQIRQQGQPE